MEESLRRLHYKFTGDAKLAQAMMEAESVIRKAAEMNVVPAWSDVGQPIYTAISVTSGYFYAKAATPLSDGLLSKGFDMHDMSTLDLMFDQLKSKSNEATRHGHDDGSEKGHKKKGTHLEAMRAVVKGTKDVKSKLYRGLPDHQQKEIQSYLAKERTDVQWDSKKAGKMVHALSMQLSNGHREEHNGTRSESVRPGATLQGRLSTRRAARLRAANGAHPGARRGANTKCSARCTLESSMKASRWSWSLGSSGYHARNSSLRPKLAVRVAMGRKALVVKGRKPGRAVRKMPSR